MTRGVLCGFNGMAGCYAYVHRLEREMACCYLEGEGVGEEGDEPLRHEHAVVHTLSPLLFNFVCKCVCVCV